MEWQQNALEILDQTKLPVEISFIKCGTYRRVGEAIKKTGSPRRTGNRRSSRFCHGFGLAAAYGGKPLQFAGLRRNKK